MSFVDLQKSVGNLAKEYEKKGFAGGFNIRIFDDKDNCSGEDYDGKEIVNFEFCANMEGSIMVESEAFVSQMSDDNPDFLDNIIAEIKTKAASLGIEHNYLIEIDGGPYVWFTVGFTAYGTDVISDFPLDRLGELVEVVNSVLKPHW